MKMKTALSLVAAAVALLSHSAFAQDKSRAEVKEETKKAVKAGETKGGEGSPDLTAPAVSALRSSRVCWANALCESRATAAATSESVVFIFMG